MAQKFIAQEAFKFPNGATGWRPGGSFDCLGPYAKVQNCPVIVGGAEAMRLTCYATGYADTYFSVPASTRYRGQHIRGYFALDNGDIQFRVMDSHKGYFAPTPGV